MERDHQEWRQPWTEPGVERGSEPGVERGSEPVVERRSEPVIERRSEPVVERWSEPGVERRSEPLEVARPRPLAPPSTWDARDAGPGSPPGSVRPPDTVGTVDAPPRPRRRGIGTALLAGLLGAIVGTTGTLAVVDPGPDDVVASDPTPPEAPVQAPVIDIENLDTGSVVPAVAQAVTPSVVRIDILGNGEDGAQEQIGLGSGVIYRSDGYIITNNHVVEEADSLRVKLADGEEFPAEIVGTDPLNDLAVLKIEASGLPAINLRTDREPVVGETAIAIGSPFGLDTTVTAGVVSATGRDITVPTDDGPQVIPQVIQTDAAINPGNSGGALVDREGRLMGINTAILSATGGSQGVGFAIPVTQAVTSAEQLIATGEVQYPLMGVRGGDVTPEIAQRLGLDDDEGALIDEVTPGSGADAAGLQRDDVVVAVDGEAIESMLDLVVAVRSYQPGDVIEVTYLRDGQQRTTEVTLGNRDDLQQ